MTAQGLIRRFAVEPRVVDPPDFPQGEQLRLLTELQGLYEREGLIEDGETHPLWACCPHAADCWRAPIAHRPSARNGRSGVALPWVGPHYQPGGVAVIAINLRDAGGLLQEYEITCETAGEPSQLNRLAAGYRTAHGSRFAYGSTRSASVVLDWLEDRPIVDRDDAAQLASVLKRIVRLQAIKCSPHDGDRSSPATTMAHNCPRYLLEREIAVVQPAVLVTVGAAAWRAVYDMPGYVDADGGTERLSYGTLRIDGGRCWVFSLDHPVAGNRWDRGHQDLLHELARLDHDRPRGAA
jgi:hypothetical protein